MTDPHTHDHNDHTHDHGEQRETVGTAAASDHGDQSHDAGHSHGAGHSRGGGGHMHDHGHRHDREHGHGVWGVLKGIFAPHSHDAADSVDNALESSAAGIKVVKIGLLVLGSPR